MGVKAREDGTMIIKIHFFCVLSCLLLIFIVYCFHIIQGALNVSGLDSGSVRQKQNSLKTRMC